MYYKRLAHGLTGGFLFPITDDINKYITNRESDWYVSIYDYEDRHYEAFQRTNSVKGIEDVTACQLSWDFDDIDLEKARKDALELCKRLYESGIHSTYLKIAFSGQKGFEVTLFLNERISVNQYKAAWKRLSDGLPTNDVRVANPSRYFRVVNTRHPATGLYKIPLTYYVLKGCPIQKIKEMAVAPVPIPEWKKMSLPEDYFKIVEKKKDKELPLEGLNLSLKPKFLTNCRYALQNGFFKAGDRNSTLLCLASTYKNLGFDLEHVYRMLKGVAELQAKRYSCERYSDGEIYNNIVTEVFGPGWKGGQFTCRESTNWLYHYCNTLGDQKCNHKAEDELEPRTFIDLRASFKEYVQNIDKNTIYTGLPSVDKYVFLSTGCNAGIIGSSGSGKTSIGLEILNNTSKAGVVSVCASLDMAKNRIFEKVLYRLTGWDRSTLYEVFKADKEERLMEKLVEEFGNVYFFKKTCPTVTDIKEYILNIQEKTGKKVKLLVTDYFERIVCDISDDTASSKRIAGELQDLVDDLDICNITLVQPNKNALSGGPDVPIYDYTKIKGSSFLYQAFRIIMSCWRPFYNPKDFSKDHWMKMAVCKNDLGELSEMSFGWEGKRGLITELEDYQKDELEQLIRQKENDKKSSGEANGSIF